jgi:hypothetical protein
MIARLLSTFFWSAIALARASPIAAHASIWAQLAFDNPGDRNSKMPVAAAIRTDASGSLSKSAKYGCKSLLPIDPIARAAIDLCLASLLFTAGTATFHPSSDPSIPSPRADASETSG